MNKFIGLIILLITFFAHANNDWLKKYTRTKTFTYDEFFKMTDDNNQDVYQKLFVIGYYNGIVNGTLAINSVADHEGISTLYCIPPNKNLSIDEYMVFMKVYYASLSKKQRESIEELPIEIVHLRTLKNLFPCNTNK